MNYYHEAGGWVTFPFLFGWDDAIAIKVKMGGQCESGGALNTGSLAFVSHGY